MPDKYLICENCQQVVARFNPKTITYPVRSTMFESKFPAERHVPSPWVHREVDAEWMTCPFCPKRVFNQRDPSVLTVSDSIEGYRPHSLDIGLAAVGTLGTCKPGKHKWVDAGSRRLFCSECSATSMIDDHRDRIGVSAAPEPKTDPVRASTSPDPDMGNTDVCPVCGKERDSFKNASGFANHMRYCAAKHGGGS